MIINLGNLLIYRRSVNEGKQTVKEHLVKMCD